jgi:predicted ATPase
MITHISIKNFKKLETVSFPLAQSVVIIGPNNSGKSTIFQALCLWEIGVTNFIQANIKNDLNRSGAVTINRRDLLNSPIADARFLWRKRKVTETSKSGQTKHVKLEVELKGEEEGKEWTCNAEFEFSNAESFSCRINSGLKELKSLYENDKGIHFGFLQPMSGISTNEDKLTQGSISRKLGEGKTAEVLRNICYEILFPDTPHPTGYDPEDNWKKLCQGIKSMFGADLLKPEFIKATGIIQLQYRENEILYDISSAGRGFQQTLLLLSYMYANPNVILLLDEPDAHLEVIRQREAFQIINEVASDMNSQVLIASHSEVVLDEAADASKIVAIIENTVQELNSVNSSQKLKNFRKSLTDIGWEKYYLAKSKKHILYLEGSTDLEMLKQFALKINHKVEPYLKFANVQYTSDNVPWTAISNFVSLSEIFPELKGLAIFDYLPNLQPNPKLNVVCWSKRELENYFAKPELLIRHASLMGNQYPYIGGVRIQEVMRKTIEDVTPKIYLNDPTNEWWNKTKLSDDWLDIIFNEFYKRLKFPQDFYKRDYYKLIRLLNPSEVDKEITEKLDLIGLIIIQ